MLLEFVRLKEQGTLSIKNGPVSKFIEIGKVAQQHFTCFRTLNFIQMYQFVFLLQLFKQSIVLANVSINVTTYM